MKLILVAATGGIGKHVLEQARAAGHDVTAVVRNPGKLPRDVRVVQADLAHPEPSALEVAVKGADAVLSCLGAVTRADHGVARRGTQALVDAMKSGGVKRLLVVSAAPIGTVASSARPDPPKYDPGDGFLMRHFLGPLIKAILRAHYQDLAQMEDVVRGSQLDWTIVRPPRLTDQRSRGQYRTALGQNVRGGLSISRADVAHFMLAALTRPETVDQTVGIAQ